jgi:hypothetical protein
MAQIIIAAAQKKNTRFMRIYTVSYSSSLKSAIKFGLI